MSTGGDIGWLPLTGCRVVDAADERGEMCGRILADLGADVVRLEPAGGARSRQLPPFHGSTSLYFAVRNANKRVASLDLDTPAGRAALERALAGADLWIESERPGYWDALGLPPAELVERHPRLVVTSITDFGQTGPYRDYEATDAVIVAMSSLLSRSGVVGLPPLLPPCSVAYDCAGVTGALASLLALWQRDRTGRGQWIDVSALDSLAQSTDWGLVGYSASISQGAPLRQTRDGSGPYPLLECADGLVRMPVLKPSEWHALRSWLGDPEELRDPAFESIAGRARIRDSILIPACTSRFAGRTKLEVTQEAQSRRIAVTPVLTPPEVVASPHFRDRQSIVTTTLAGEEGAAAVSGLFRFNGRRAGIRHEGRDSGGLEEAAVWGAPGPGAPSRGSAELPDEPGSGPSRPSGGLPLEGLLVLDFGQGGVGVEIGRLLAEYGADVVKVEGRRTPDFMRLLSGTEMTPAFASSSRSKRSFGVTIRSPEGLALVQRLVARADVVVENSAPGAMDRLGLGWSEISRINPRCVMLSSQLLGPGGPWEHWKGYGPNTRAAGGMTYLWNFPDRDVPPGTSLSFPDHFAGRVGAVGVLAGLLYRRVHGAGTHVESAQVDSILFLLSDAVAKEGLQPGSVRPQGNRSERGAPWGVYPCAGEERWCAITCRHDRDWAGLRAAMGDPGWARSERFGSVPGRLAAADELDGHVSAWTEGRTDAEVMQSLQAHGVPAGAMLYVADQAHDPHLLARGFVHQVEQPGAGLLYFDGPSFQSTGMAEVRIGPAPGLGQDTRDICRNWLDMDDEEIDRLVARGVLDEDATAVLPRSSA